MSTNKQQNAVWGIVPLLESDVFIIAPDGRKWTYLFQSENSQAKTKTIGENLPSSNRRLLPEVINKHSRGITVIFTGERLVLTPSSWLNEIKSAFCEMPDNEFKSVMTPLTREGRFRNQLLPLAFLSQFTIVKITNKKELVKEVDDIFVNILFKNLGKGDAIPMHHNEQKGSALVKRPSTSVGSKTANQPIRDYSSYNDQPVQDYSSRYEIFDPAEGCQVPPETEQQPKQATCVIF